MGQALSLHANAFSSKMLHTLRMRVVGLTARDSSPSRFARGWLTMDHGGYSCSYQPSAQNHHGSNVVGTAVMGSVGAPAIGRNPKAAAAPVNAAATMAALPPPALLYRAPRFQLL